MQDESFEQEDKSLIIQNYSAEVLTGEIVDVQESRDSIVSGDINGSFRSFQGYGFGRVTGSVSTTVDVRKTIFVKLQSGKEIQVNLQGDVVSLRVGQEVTLCEVGGRYIFMYNHNTEYFYNFCAYFGPWDKFLPIIVKSIFAILLFIFVCIGFLTIAIAIFAFFIGIMALISGNGLQILLYSILAVIAGIVVCLIPVFLLVWYLKIPAAKNRKIIDSAAGGILRGKNIDSYINVYTF